MRVVLGCALLLTGCSLFFDPGRAPVGCKVELCKARTNAIATCANSACAYRCAPGRSDPNGDLASETGNGCEACLPAANPTELHALVGNPSGGIQWQWPRPSGAEDAGTAAPTAFTLCTGAMPSALGTCQSLDASVACTGDGCGLLTLGHPNDVRVFARVQSTDECGATTAGGPVQGASAIDGTLLSIKPTNAGGDSPCDAGFLDAGALKIEQTGTCLSAITFGDDQWEDFTLTGQIQLTDRPPVAGFAFHYPAVGAKSRSSVMLTPETQDSEFTVALTTIPTGQSADRIIGTSGAAVRAGEWLDVSIVSKGGEVAASVGSLGGAKPVVLRGYEPSVGRKGRFGVYLFTAFAGQYESVQFRNVQVSTQAVLPPRGATTVKPAFTGTALPAEARVIPRQGASPNVVMTSCFNGAEATGCPAGTCTPAAGSTCLQINQNLLGRRSVSFDQPVGLDTKQPWRISFKFLAMTPNDNLAPILRTQVGGPIVRGPMGNWPGPLTVFGTVTDGTVEIMKWNKLDLTFTGSTFEMTMNGKKLNAPPLFPLPGWEPHLGAITFGGPEGLSLLLGWQGTVQGQWTDLEIAQPP